MAATDARTADIEASFQRLYNESLETSYRGAGAGSYSAQYQMVLSKIDRFGYNILLLNQEKTGLTFITRPKLNLSTSSLRQDRILTTLDTIDNMSWPFSMRCLLDTNFSKRSDISGLAEYCPFFDNRSPFITPLTNCLSSISGYPDFVIDTETTDPGFFNEDITFARGSDLCARTYDLNLTFREIQGGYIWALLVYWHRYISLLPRGIVLAYIEDIEMRRLCYTSSIYRFILDPSRRYITKYSKATGCFPASFPTGSGFNIAENETHVSSTAQYSVVFKANNVEYMDPIILQEFNVLMKRYCPNIETSSYVDADATAYSNFCGLPYIKLYEGRNELAFRCLPEELEDTSVAAFNSLMEKLNSATK
jgi:hypothetical protein